LVFVSLEPTKVKDPLGKISKLNYDSFGQVTSITNARNETSTLTYDVRENVIKATDALNRSSRFTKECDPKITLIASRYRLGLGGTDLTYSSSNCFLSTVEGASHIRSCALCVFGKAITSRIESSPSINIIRRSKP
jgi:YD repeat-containing protein